MAYTTIDDPSAYFHTQLFTGTGSELSVTNDANAGDFKPDWIWIKQRNAATDHGVFDSTRGVTKNLKTNKSDAESTEVQSVKTFNTDGFTLGTSGDYNGSSDTHVAWQWKANGGTTSSNSDGSITSTVQANTTAGFSIITYTGTGSNATIGHGLGSAPTMVIVKNRSSAEHWMVGHHKNSNGFQSSVFLNLTAGKDTDAVYFNNTAPTSTVISIGTNDKINHSSENHVMYAFAEKQGYSKFGSYTGNGNADGPFIYTGFAPAWVMVKNIASAIGWVIQDNTRSSTNPRNKRLFANITDAEATDTDFDFLSNGFKLRNSGNTPNKSGEVYIYMAFAEHPFVSSEGVPVTAR
jgi:hypothetical protein